MDHHDTIHKFYSLCEWIMKLAYLNILWIGFSLLGLVVFGFFPATIAMFTISRKWLMGQSEIPIFKTFWDTYSKEFLHANVLGFILAVIGYILYVDFRFFLMTADPMLRPLTFLFFIFLVIYVIVLLYVFPVYVHFDIKLLKHIKYSLVIAMGKIFQSFVMVMSSMIIYFLFSFIPGLIPFFSGSILSLLLMWIAFRSFPQTASE